MVTITSGVNASNVESAKNQVTNMVACIQVEARKVNLMEIGKVINEIYQVKKDKASKLLNSIENCSNWIYNFSNMPSIAVQQIESFIKSIDTAVKEIDNIFYKNDFLNNINSAIESNECVYEESATLAIRMYRTQIELGEMANYMIIINSIYERVCAIFNVSASEYKLMPIKIESGSWYEKIFGNSKVMAFIEDWLNRAVGFIYRNYTNEGKLKGQSNKINALKENLKLTELCEKHGINTEEAKKVLKQNLDALCLDTYKLTTRNNKISIGENVYDLGKEISQAVLESASDKYIDTPRLEKYN